MASHGHKAGPRSSRGASDEDYLDTMARAHAQRMGWNRGRQVGPTASPPTGPALPESPGEDGADGSAPSEIDVDAVAAEVLPARADGRRRIGGGLRLVIQLLLMVALALLAWFLAGLIPA